MGEKLYDAIIVGSGAAGSIAVKELTGRGMSVLLLEAGPYLGPEDFKDSAAGAGEMKTVDTMTRIRAALHGQYTQARTTLFNDRNAHLFVNDWQNPYSTPWGEYFLWIRGRQLGGRLHTYGRMLLRMSDCDFKALGRDGHSFCWPISYLELAPYYDSVEELLGVYGTAEGIPNLPDGKYVKAPRLTRLEESFKARIESTWPGTQGHQLAIRIAKSEADSARNSGCSGNRQAGNSHRCGGETSDDRSRHGQSRRRCLH